mmetsp:Transcript_87383/g.282326  ORF Transcript_87383/g.282326 Transcript_87383/m.282326 type:complete len:275 (-) Transcript_87383:336-1160(-)
MSQALLGTEFVVHCEPKGDACRHTPEHKLQVMCCLFTFGISVGSPTAQVVDAKLNACYTPSHEHGDAKHAIVATAASRLVSATAREIDKDSHVEDSHSNLVCVLQLVRQDLELLQVDCDKQEAGERQADVEQHKQLEKSGVVVLVAQRPWGITEREDVDGVEDKGCAKFQIVESLRRCRRRTAFTAGIAIVVIRVEDRTHQSHGDIEHRDHCQEGVDPRHRDELVRAEQHKHVGRRVQLAVITACLFAIEWHARPHASTLGWVVHTQPLHGLRK